MARLPHSWDPLDEAMGNEALCTTMFEFYSEHITISNGVVTSSFFEISDEDLAAALANATPQTYPFGLIYDACMESAAIGETAINLESIDRIRTKLISLCIEDMDRRRISGERYDNQIVAPLFDYLRKLRDAGHLEAYNYWLLRSGDRTAYASWYSRNQEKYSAFWSWLKENKLTIDKPQ